MSVAYLVIYEGQPEDPEAFLRYYVEKHVPLLWAFPGIRGVEVQRGVDGGGLLHDRAVDLRFHGRP